MGKVQEIYFYPLYMSSKLKSPAKKDSGNSSKDPAWPIVIVSLYALTEFFPQLQAVDVMGSQWLFAACLNLITLLLLFKHGLKLPSDILRNGAVMVLGGFTLIGGLSFFAAFNAVESLVTYCRFLTMAIGFMNVLLLIYYYPNTIRKVIPVIAVVLVFQSLYELAHFLEGLQKRRTLDEIIFSLKGNTGNKNFLGAGILLRIPFLLYFLLDKKFAYRTVGSLGLAVSASTLVMLNSRSTILAFLVISLVFLMYLLYSWKQETERRYLYSAGLYMGILLSVYVITTSTFSTAEKLSTKGSYGNVTERINSISFTNEGSSGRVRLWTSAIDFIAKHPLTGGGFGNWKIHSIPYEATTIRGFGLRKHVHNDYLEVTADTGIAGGLLFTAFLVLIAVFAGRLIMKGKNKNFNSVLLILLLSHLAYMSDSMFNFPLERANMAMHMIVCAAAITALYIRQNDGVHASDKRTENHRFILWIFVSLSAVCCWTSLQAYRSMAVQNKIAIEWFDNPKEAKPPFKSENINPSFPAIPNLNELGMPISCMKAKYLAQEGKYTDALAELERGNQANPYLYYAEFLKTNMALAENRTDTAFYYVKIAYYNRPANQQLFNLLCDIAYNLKDTAELSRAFTLKTSTRPEESDYVKYATFMYALNNDLSVRKDIIEKGLTKYAGSKLLTFEKYFGLGLEYAAKEMHDSAAVNYERAVAIQPNAFASKNAGVCYLQMKKYKEAIPHFTAAIASGQFNDGLPEYGRGACYYNMQRYDEACPDIRVAIQRGFPVEANVVARCSQ